MSHPEQHPGQEHRPSLESRIGARPAGGSAMRCRDCGHPYALHSNGKSACKAFACTAGPDGGPCPEFAVPEATARLAS